MPQIAQIGEIYASQLFWLAIVFGAIFLVVGLGMVPKIQGTVDARDNRIAEARSAAQAEIETVAAEAAAAMVQRVAGLTVDPATAHAAVQGELVRG